MKHLLALLLIASSSVALTSSQSQPLEGEALFTALRGGGFVFFFRHARTDFSQMDVAGNDLNDCAKQRNLSADGRVQSTAIGEAMRQRRIPVSRVLVSPYCRTRETARLAFPAFSLEVSKDLVGGISERCAACLRTLLSITPAPRTNTVLVSHQFNFRDVTDLSLEEGEAAVVQPLGTSGFRVVARVTSDAW
ncbi:MAG: histidine phosphatase family protein [Pleurocapsa sp. SU_196_0]|nr:histidine phosphatase family protein [Pleurocapsa sp. SU_196_0]